MLSECSFSLAVVDQSV